MGGGSFALQVAVPGSAVLFSVQCGPSLCSSAHLFCASLQNRGGIYLKHQLSGFLAPFGSTQSIKF